jgi:hypothetical protein
MLPVELMVGIPRAVAIFYHAFFNDITVPTRAAAPHTRREGRGASRDLLRRPSRIGHPAWAGGREAEGIGLALGARSAHMGRRAGVLAWGLGSSDGRCRCLCARVRYGFCSLLEVHNCLVSSVGQSVRFIT